MALQWLDGVEKFTTSKGKEGVAFGGFCYFLTANPPEDADKHRLRCSFTHRCLGKFLKEKFRLEKIFQNFGAEIVKVPQMCSKGTSLTNS